MTKLKQIILLLLVGSSIHAKNIIWDLGDTLFRISPYKMAWKIGIWNIASYSLFDWRSPNIKHMLYDVLDKLNPSEEHPYEIATDNEGRPMPIIMHHWLAGAVSGTEVMKSVREYIDHLELQHYFVSAREKRLLLAVLEQMFNPEAFVDTIYPIMDGINLLHDCYHAKDAHGKLKNKLFVLSNWDEASSEVLQRRYADIFNTYFHGVIMSGAIGLIKPQKNAFEYVLKTYDLDPKETIFIDDQYDNILAAQSVGIIGLLMCRDNYKTLRNVLTKLGALE